MIIIVATSLVKIGDGIKINISYDVRDQHCELLFKKVENYPNY